MQDVEEYIENCEQKFTVRNHSADLILLRSMVCATSPSVSTIMWFADILLVIQDKPEQSQESGNIVNHRPRFVNVFVTDANRMINGIILQF